MIPCEKVCDDGQASWPATTRYWHKISISLSEKDLKRWQTAGASFSHELLRSNKGNRSAASNKSEKESGTPLSQQYRSFEAYLLPKKDNSKDWYQSAGYLTPRRRNANGNFPDEWSIVRIFV